jgi:hypothetical protein|tara:strand:- start:1716 stop:1886 length:171 start_codon:yes stop_codon:yes gene_type:complete
MKIVQWALSRIAEPSSYAGLSAVIVGIGFLVSHDWIVFIGILVGLGSIALSESKPT